MSANGTEFGSPRKLEGGEAAAPRSSSQAPVTAEGAEMLPSPGQRGLLVTPMVGEGRTQVTLTRFSWPGAPWAWSPARRSP